MYAKIVLMTAAILFSGQVLAQSTTTPKATKKKKTTTTTTAPVVVVEEKKVEVAPVAVATVPAENVPTNSFLKYMKEKFSVSYHGEFLTARRCDGICEGEPDALTRTQDMTWLHNPTIIYKPFKDWQILSSTEFKYSDNEAQAGDGFRNGFFRTLFTVQKKNILTEKDHGIKLDAGVGRRQFYTGATPIAYPSYGNNRAFATITKTFGKHSANLFLQYFHNDYKHPTKTTWDHGIEILPTLSLQLTEKLNYTFNDDITINHRKHAENSAREFFILHELNLAYITYQWTEKFATYYQFKYTYNSGFNYNASNQYQTENIQNAVGLAYSFTPNITLSMEVAAEAFASHDNRFFSQKVKYPDLAFYLDMSL